MWFPSTLPYMALWTSLYGNYMEIVLLIAIFIIVPPLGRDDISHQHKNEMHSERKKCTKHSEREHKQYNFTLKTDESTTENSIPTKVVKVPITLEFQQETWIKFNSGITNTNARWCTLPNQLKGEY